MKGLFLIASLAGLSGCAQMPSLFQAVDDIETQQAVSVIVDKEAIGQGKNVNVGIQIVEAPR